MESSTTCSLAATSCRAGSTARASCFSKSGLISKPEPMSNSLPNRGCWVAARRRRLYEPSTRRGAINDLRVLRSSADGLRDGRSAVPACRGHLHKTAGPRAPTHCSCHVGASLSGLAPIRRALRTGSVRVALLVTQLDASPERSHPDRQGFGALGTSLRQKFLFWFLFWFLSGEGCGQCQQAIRRTPWPNLAALARRQSAARLHFFSAADPRQRSAPTTVLTTTPTTVAA